MKTKMITEKPAIKKGGSWKYIKSNIWLYVMLILPLAYIIVFSYLPMFGVVIAFKDFNIIKGIADSPWAGFKYFEYLFTSADFYKVLRNSLVMSFYRIIFAFPVPIILALFLSEIRNKAFKLTSQTILYLPHFISWVVLAGMINQFLSPSEGIINYIIKMFGGESIAFLQKPQYFRGIVVISEIWKNAGWDTIIYLAAIIGIDQDLYEAAAIDGASRWQQTIKITLPCIMNTIIVMLVLKMGNVLRNGFEQILLLYNPMTYEVADVFETYTYRLGILGSQYSYSTAVGIFQSVVGMIMITGANYISRKFSDTSLY